MHKFKCLLICIALFTLSNLINAQPKTDTLLNSILSKNKNQLFNEIFGNQTTYRCQIIYTQINRDKKNVPSFKNYYFNYDSLLYFNPASTVKLPLAFLSLEKMSALASKGITINTPLQIDSSYPGQKTAYRDTTSKSSLPSIAHYIKKAFLISDNDAYNRMYEFVGQQTINSNLHKKGYRDVRITRQFMGYSDDQNRHTNQFRFITHDGKTIFTQPPAYNTDSFDFSHIIKLGKAHYNRNDSLVNQPFDFTMQNNLSLKDLQQILQSVLFPASVSAKQRFDIRNNDRKFALQYLSQFPSETNYPLYDTSKFFDTYVKFFFRDSTRKMPDNIRVFNKVGWSYGFMTDVSYVADFKNKVEFMLSATIYVNSDEVLNDDKYDYNSKGYPFFYQLGQTVYQYELKRKRLFKPDLADFKLNYEQREKNPGHPVILEVDN